MKLKKRDRVEFEYEGKTVYGVVEKGGSKKIEVVIDGGDNMVGGSPKCFRLSDEPLPKDEPNVMDKWSVKGRKDIEGHGDSPTFSAKICLSGKPVMHVGNNGWGGGNEYHPLKGFDYSVFDQFIADVRAWVGLFGDETMHEPDDFWVSWYTDDRPYGITAKQSIEQKIAL